jgi:diacylglycerol kinase (ATP)
MAATAEARATRVFVILNPVAGGYLGETVRRALERHFSAVEMSYEVYETGELDRASDLARRAIERGFGLVVAAGGDGTVSGAANGLVGTATPLGIIPLGTANVLARELGIPVDPEGACRLIAGPHATKDLDAMRVGGQCYFTQVGVGIDALMIRDTRREQKRRWGRVAYLWTAAKQLAGFPPRRFTVTADGRRVRLHASEVLVANGGILGQPPFRWGPDIRPDDGRVDVCIVRARTVWDYLVLGWHVLLGQHRRDPRVRYLPARRRVTVAAKHPMPVQADGEIIGETPVEVEVVPAAVQVVVPAGAVVAPSP